MVCACEKIQSLDRVSYNSKLIINDFDKIYSEIKKLESKRKAFIFTPKGFRIFLVEISKQSRLYSILRRIFRAIR